MKKQVSHLYSYKSYLLISHNLSFFLLGVVEMDWARLQVMSTVDYAHDSPLAAFFSGALNFQAVHHLFPYISQVHYPAIAPIGKTPITSLKHMEENIAYLVY